MKDLSAGSTGPDTRDVNVEPAALTPNGGQTDRRTMLRRIGVGAGAVWVAPTVLSLNAAAAASGVCAPGQLVTNPYAGSGLSGWTTSGTVTISTDYGPVYPPALVLPPGVTGDEPNFFYLNGGGSPGSPASLSQTVSFSPACTRFSYSWWWNATMVGPIPLLLGTVTFNDGPATTFTQSFTPLAFPPTFPISLISVVDGGLIPAGSTGATITIAIPAGVLLAVDIITFTAFS